MASEFKSEIVNIDAPVQAVFDKFSDLENLRALIDKLPADKLPADKRAQFEKMQITRDSVRIEGGPMGPITMTVTERRSPSLIALRPSGLPIDLTVELRLAPDGPEACTAQVVVEADIPMMLRPMVKGPLQQFVDTLAKLVGQFKYTAD